MITSESGIALIKRFEGLRLNAYRDSAGVWTIGYGSTRFCDGEPVTEGATLNRAGADALLMKQLPEYEQAVRDAVTVPLSQSQFDALVSLCWNIGPAAFRASTLVARLNAGDSVGAANQFLRWVHAGGQPLDGLRRRREAEREMFLSGTQHANRPVALVSSWAGSRSPADSGVDVTAPERRKENPMTREIVLALVRHLLTSVGAVLVARGVTDAGTVEAIAGGVLAVVGLALSYRDKVARVPA